MINRIRHLRFGLRALFAALLSLCVVVVPALASVSEAHEATHQLQTGHTHDADGHGHGIPADEGEAPDGPGEWHLLLHFGHCCGHGTMLLPAPILLDPLQTVTLAATTEYPAWPSTRQSRQLRPPISE